MKEIDLTMGEALTICQERGWDVQPWRMGGTFVCGKPVDGMIEVVALGTSYTKAVENAIRASKKGAIND